MLNRILLALILFNLPLLSKPNVLFPDKIQTQGYGAPVLKIGPMGIDDQISLITGAEGGWLLDKRFLAGGGIYALATELKPRQSPTDSEYLTLNYGGILLGYVHNSDAVLHWGVNCLAGGGRLAYRDATYDIGYGERDWVWVLEPRAELELNLVPGTRVAVGAAYRFFWSVQYQETCKEDLQGPALTISVKLGNM